MSVKTALFVSVVLGASVIAQENQQPTFRGGTQVVSLFATVTDSGKRLVPSLVKEDFEVFDNDKPQPLVFFENDPQPITVVVMLDTSGSMTALIKLLKRAAEQFLLRLLPADKGRVGAFNDKIEFNAHFSSNRDELIIYLEPRDGGNGTRLWDAVNASLDELKGIQGRRVVLVFTDGEDTESKIRLGPVIDRARAEEVMVYGIGFESVYFDGQRMVKSKPDGGLQKLVDETGGGYFRLDKSDSLGATFTRVAQELHSQYVLGFAPTQLDGKVHRLAVRLKQPGMVARARRSYVADPDKFSIQK